MMNLTNSFPSHLPVLYQETIASLNPQSPGLYVDATVGAGGHASGILSASAPLGQLLGLDVDPQALALAGQKLSSFGERAILRKASYVTIKEQIALCGWKSVQGILIDLGVSSMQVDTAERGFSFLKEGPLDMRFDTEAETSAAELVNDLPEDELVRIIQQYGEEPEARRIARSIVENRPFQTTLELASVIHRAVRQHRGRVHPATRTFQALRIAVNQELQSLHTFLPQAIEILAPGGRLSVISFHSLEDRIVKEFFARESRDCLCPPKQPVCTCSHKASIRLVNRHTLTASEEEIRLNPRSRSARLRIVEKIGMA